MGNLVFAIKAVFVGHRIRPKYVKLGASLSPNWNIWEIIRLRDSVYALCNVRIRDVILPNHAAN